MKIVEWVKDHKKAIIFGGVAIAAGVAGYKGVKKFLPVKPKVANKCHCIGYGHKAKNDKFYIYLGHTLDPIDGLEYEFVDPAEAAEFVKGFSELLNESSDVQIVHF